MYACERIEEDSRSQTKGDGYSSLEAVSKAYRNNKTGVGPAIGVGLFDVRFAIDVDVKHR